MEHSHRAVTWILVRPILCALAYSTKNRPNLCFLPDYSCFAGWEHRHRNNCLRDENHERTHQLFYSQHGHVRSAFPNFLIPWNIQGLHINSWLISGHLGKALCKLVYFLPMSPWLYLFRAWFLKQWIVLELWYFPSVLHSSVQSYHPFRHSRHLDHPDGCWVPISRCRQTC